MRPSERADPEARPVPLRIVQLAEYYRPRLGGVEVFVADLADRLSASDHEVHVLTTTPADEERQGGRIPVVDEARAPAVEVERIESWRVPSLGVPLSPRLPARFETALRRIRPDVVHVHASIASAGALAGGWAAHRLGLPIVVTVHSLLGEHAWLHRLTHGWTGWGRWPHVVAGPSQAVADAVGQVLERTTTVLPNGVDVAWWRQAERRPPPQGNEALRLVTVQRLKGRKRTAELLDALHGMRMDTTPRPVHLTVVGDGPRRDALEEQARRLGLAVRFLGAVPRRSVRTALGQAHLFVLPSDQEAFGIAVAEARAAGLPVVAFRTGALPRLVPHGRAGLLVGSDRELAHAIGRLASRPALLAELAAGSRSTPPPCDWPDVLSTHLDAYRRAMELRTLTGRRPTPAR